MKKHIAPLIVLDDKDELAKRFDHLMLTIELALLQSKDPSRNVKIAVSTAESLSHLYLIPQVKAQKQMIEKAMNVGFWGDASILDLEEVRVALRDLVQYIERKKRKIYFTDFEGNIIDQKEGESIHLTNDLKNYRAKVEFYLKEHQDTLAVYKLRKNKKLNTTDMQELERILWTELGSKEEYEKEYGDTPIGRLVRKIVGVDREAVNEAFSEFLDEQKLNINQIRFVRLMIDYIVVNGNIEDNRVLMEEPFRSCGSITKIFNDKMDVARKLMEISAEIRRNSEEIA